MTPEWIAVIVLLALSFGAWRFLGRDDDKPQR